MQGFTHLVLLALLFTISVLVQSSSVTISSINSSDSTPTSPGTTNSSDSTPTSPGTTNSSDSTPTSPGTTNSSDSTPTSPGTTNSSDSTPTSPGTTNSSDSTPTSPGTTNSSDSTPTSPGTTNSSDSTPTSPGTTNSSDSTPTSPGTTNSSESTPTSPGTTNSSDSTPTSTNSTSPTTSTIITSNTTGDSNTTSAGVSNTTVSATPTTTGPHNPCLDSNCTGGSSCVNLNTAFFCICQEGYYYNQSKCQEGRVFPGTLTSEELYTSDLEDKGSMTYQEYHYNITKFFKGAFNESVYGQTVIHKVSLSTSEKSNSRVKVTVVNILNKDCNLTEQEVTKAIRIRAVSVYPQTVSYTSENLCDYYNCERNKNNCADGSQCVCKSGMYRPTPQASHCVPILCPQSCTSKYNKHCQWDETVARSKCVCLPDYKDDGKGICQKCAFGYRGVNCQDNFQLILTIVGSTAGICILVLLIAMIFMGVRSRSRQKNTDTQKLVEKDSQNMAMQHTEYSGPYTDGSIFPKVQTSSSSQLNNPYKW